MKTSKMHCKGISPLLMDKMTEATLNGLANPAMRPQIDKNRSFDLMAGDKIYRDPNGRIALPAEMLFSCLVGAGRNIKVGKKGVSTATTTMLPDLLSIQDSYLPLTNIPEGVNGAEKDYWSVDKRRGVGYNGKTPTAVAVIRPKFVNWEFSVTVTHGDKVSADFVKELFLNAGSTQGLGSFRPNKKGMFGRFTVTKVEEVKQ